MTRHIKLFTQNALLLLAWLAGPTATEAQSTLLLEAENFAQAGGWVIDQQSMDQMGSPYLMAHGLGNPVVDATTTILFPETGDYRVWVRTRDWTAPWKQADTPPAMRAVGTPGIFQLLVNGKSVETSFGATNSVWHWQDGGIITIESKHAELVLHDLKGFNGRCDAILFCLDHNIEPPNQNPEMSEFRRRLLGHPKTPQETSDYDLVVVGGGMAGCCTAISAARRGCRVALIQNRPVLGGNNSSEVRVGLSGLIHQQPYPNLGALVDEIGPVGHWNAWEAKQEPNSPRSKHILDLIEKHPEKRQHNAGPETNYEDQQKSAAIRAEKNIDLYLNMHVNDVRMSGMQIESIVAQDIRSGQRQTFSAPLFADCTGDGNLGFLAGADYNVGREAKHETNELLAPEKSDNLVMGTSVQWNSVIEEKPSSFPDCPWAIQFDENSCTKSTLGDWDWETGALRDQVTEIEYIRDYALRIIFGNWAVLKNHARFKNEFTNRRLAWAAYIGGKRESRRLLGDVILRQQDIENHKEFSDACVTTTWSIDLHYPIESAGYAGEAFRSTAKHVRITPYPIPYRCLYSRNVSNLFMAGRNISVTHIALGTVRVMRTTSMMGEVVGMAAALCKEHACAPRDVYAQHLSEFKLLLQQGVPNSQTPAKLERAIGRSAAWD
jgi:hypothetical protein